MGGGCWIVLPKASARLFGCLDFPAFDRRHEGAVIGFGLIRIFAGEIPQRLGDLHARATVSLNLARITRAGVPPRQQFAGNQRQDPAVRLAGVLVWQMIAFVCGWRSCPRSDAVACDRAWHR
jgi:hypothetical protein